MMYLLYNILITFLLILAFPYILLRSLLQTKFRKEISERLGFFQRPSFHQSIWVHAASVGEVLCSAPLLRKIKKELPKTKIVLSTMTRTGNETARKSIPEADFTFFFPIDHPLFLGRTIAKIQPSLLLIAETELWPNLLRACGRKGIPILLFNGRISDRSFPRYLILKFFFKRYLKYVSLFMMQTERDQDRIIEMGAPRAKTRVLGNIKFDQAFPPSGEPLRPGMANALGLRGDENLLIAGSTHPGEEEILISIFKELRRMDSRLILVLAPRHLERLGDVEKILMKGSLSWIRKTSLPNLSGPEKRFETILLDTMGELMKIYRLGTLVFIGGSLVPVGGHNPLEPLFFKKPVLFGPHMFNFSEISRSLVETGGAIQVKDGGDLLFQLKNLVMNEEARKQIGEKGYQFIERHCGATGRIFEALRPFLVS